MPNETSCLYTKVKNISGATRTFSYLPPHGRTLTNNQELSFIGGLTDGILMNRRPSRILASLEEDLKENRLSVLSTPSPILYDATDDRSAMLKLDNERLYTIDPCYEDTAFQSSVAP